MLKTLLLLVAVVTAGTAVAVLGRWPPASAAGTPLLGDVNCDGVVDTLDALAILRKVAVLPVYQVLPCPTIGA